MFAGVGFFLGLAAGCGLLAARAAGQSDRCQNAINVGPGIYSGSTVGATVDGEGSCDFRPAGPDVWLKFVPPSNGVLRADTCLGASFDTVISVHSGCPGNVANEIACGDDSCLTSASVLVQVTQESSYFIRVAGFNGASGTFTLNLRFDTGHADALAGELVTVLQRGRTGSEVGLSADSPLCNAGTSPLQTFGNPDPRHPFFTWNLYRLKDGNLRQIGRSWVKHMLGAGQSDECSLGCQPNSDFLHLGVACSDTYSASFNANQNYYGPRSEIDPWTGAFTWPGSVLQQSQPVTSEVERVIRVQDADLDPAQNSGAAYFCEFLIVSADDGTHANNLVRRQFTVAGSPGGLWTFAPAPGATTIGPALESWPGATVTAIATPADSPGAAPSDGRCFVAVKVTPTVNQTWHYEYAVFNHDMKRGIRSFRVPIGSRTTASNVGFSAPSSVGEHGSNDPWSVAKIGWYLQWSTDGFENEPSGNPLRWGAMYNFWFDTTTPPVASTVSLGLYEPGTPDRLQGDIAAPAVPCRADWDEDGSVLPADIALFVQVWFACVISGGSTADWDGNGAVDPADVASFVQAWYSALTNGC